MRRYRAYLYGQSRAGQRSFVLEYEETGMSDKYDEEVVTPCPFCGYMTGNLESNPAGEYWVECGYCSTTGPIYTGEHAKGRAATSWNVRDLV